MYKSWVIKVTLTAVLIGVIAAAAAVLYVARDHPAPKHLVKHTVARPTETDYKAFVATDWRYDIETNAAAKSMLNAYWSYRNGHISSTALGNHAATTVAKMRHLSTMSSRPAPTAYKAFDKKAESVLAAEIECVNYFSSGRGVLIDALGDQLFRLITLFSGVDKSMPMPHGTVRV